MNPQRDIHPALPRLDAVAAGEERPEVDDHLATCATCAAYVARLAGEAAAFRARVDPDAFARGVLQRGAARRARRVATLAWVGAPALAIAAASLLWVRAAPQGPVPSIVPAVTPTGDVPRFKGGLAVAVVRERGGFQERLTGPFEVRPGDRVRVEIAVDREEPMTAGLLGGDGTWTVLEEPAALGAGTHYSELAARFDDAPVDAILLVGAPRDVERARTSRNFDGLVAWRVVSARAEPHEK